MLLVRSLTVLVLLMAPIQALAIPVTLDVQTGSVPGFSYSWLHAADACGSGGYWMCGTTPNQTVTGSLTANQTGNAFSGISGNLLIGATSQVVSGSLDFSVASGASLGSLTIGSLGTFDFVNQNMSGPANGFSGGVISLWGQNFAPSKTPVKGGYGIDLSFKVSPAIPEPSAALVFGLGALIVRTGARRRTRKA
ncbi:MAG: hypothetical protein GY937_15225 [bacterium]|nr:hypothetical protein [bacterium]